MTGSSLARRRWLSRCAASIASARGMSGWGAGLAAWGTGAAAATAGDPVDALYPATFRLKPLAADPILDIARPRAKSPGLAVPSWIDPAYGTRIYKVTDASDMPGASFVRHEYSRRQAFNADNSRYLGHSSDGYWLLYDAQTFLRLRRGGQGGVLRGMAGDAEPLWHPTDPRLLWYTSNSGGLTWLEKNVETDFDSLMADFRGRLPWPGATAVWTKGEGSCSADGRIFGFMATSYNESTKAVTIHGIFSYDRSKDRIIGSLDASAFGRAMPDHISVSPSGRYIVPSWAYASQLGTRAYTPDFSSSRQLHSDSEHSDLAFGPNGEDYYVALNYKDGTLMARDLSTGQSFTLMKLYPRRGAAIGAGHISGQAFGRPGWIVLSTYGDSTEHGKVKPDPQLHAAHRKVMLLELKPDGRQFSLAHTRTAANYGGYFGEPQATISRDGSRVLFATNFDDGGPPSSYMIAVPRSVYER